MTVAELERALDASVETYQAEECLAFGPLLEADLRSLNRLQELERAWLAELRAGRARFDPAFDRRITNRYEHWVANAEIRLRQLGMQEEKGCRLDRADEFRHRLEEAREALGERLRDERSASDRAELIVENGDR
jgi:hypothetical protein